MPSGTQIEAAKWQPGEERALAAEPSVPLYGACRTALRQHMTWWETLLTGAVLFERLLVD